MRNKKQIAELTNILLTTGDTDVAKRSLSNPALIAYMTELVKTGGGVLVKSRLAGLQLKVSNDTPTGCAVIEFLSPADIPCVLSGVVWDEKRSEKMWEFLLTAARHSGKVASILRQPKVPWIGVVVFPLAAAFTTNELTVLGEVERSVVFAILDKAGR